MAPDAFEPIDLPAFEAGPADAGLVGAALSEVLPPAALLTRGPEFAQYGKDASRAAAQPDFVVLARRASDVRHVLHVAHHFRTPVYPRGLGSGLSGGCVPTCGGIVLDVSSLNGLVGLDTRNRSVRVGAGLTAGALNALLAEHGLWYPPWPSSRDISSLGGNFSTNAGGLTTMKYGPTRHWVLGVTVVLPGGELITAGCGAAKNVAGLDLTQLLCGSEGMLAVIVELELKLLPLPPHTATTVWAFDTDEAALLAAMDVVAGPVTPRIFEYIAAPTIACVVEHLGAEARHVLGPASAGGAVLCAEVDAFTPQDAERQLSRLMEAFQRQDGRRIGLTSDPAEALALWRVRQEVSPACFQRGRYKLADDVAVPRSALLDFDSGLKAIGAQHGLGWLNYGHIGDADFHPTLMLDGPEDPRLPAGLAALADVCQLAVSLRGSISGEHGVGSLKAPYLALQLGQRELELMRGIKAAFDPHGILNPGKWL
jgi:glycolate oxidase subunit GlcD